MTPDDLRAALAACVTGLNSVADQDWSRPAAGLDWTCLHTAEHLADDLLYYATSLAARATEQLKIWGKVEEGATNAQVIEVIRATGELFAVIGDAAPPSARAFHPAGPTDPAGYLAIGVGEALLHSHDICAAFGARLEPPADVCRAMLARLMPHVTEGGDPWQVLLLATGRGDLPGKERVFEWRWRIPIEG
ncbi:maleylpyruvate isomerase N-terminal domain-containing protein [Allokutzneria sp. A3M-2-11 16]|uniref:maleylpyruvate isomerase N-terminal domain-containing protein n=1 Tax=Allokutzneria sp. A3M-2-11 16 TaxID=2962043 RepID=UPI0020B673CD|nr:maleylpyruvate isomerase N-terminal domain-containing protein [Allokutzneria sp. A3M-2-11 16]MCP3799452.1 maleylpyruvate isomerase N-terminal domain-containing protein [Allokutzneria sp. A3M-2-11 16]